MEDVIANNTTRSKLQAAIEKIERNDVILGKELRKLRNSDKYQTEARNRTAALESFSGGLERMDDNFALETIVLRTGRPVLAIQNNAAVLDFRDAESVVWKDRLLKARQELTDAAMAVGRIELENDPSYSWVGTGWLVDKELLVTNRHVAEVFAQKQGGGFVFKTGLGGQPVKGFVDFLEEVNNAQSFTFQLDQVLHIEPAPGPDMALIRVKPSKTDRLPKPIGLFADLPVAQQDVVVVGYPARDSRIPDQQLVLNIFGDVYDKKRLAPGQVIASSASELQHDCSTLGGNSGSSVLDLDSGKAVGLHFAGRFLEANYAVPAAIIAQKIKNIGRSSVVLQSAGNGVSGGNGANGAATHDKPLRPVSIQQGNFTANGTTSTFSIPVQITVTIGQPVGSGTTGVVIPTIQNREEGETFFTEAKPDDYDGRIGYEPDFLDVPVPLPTLLSSAKRNDILKLTDSNEFELKYCHFSVVMSESRRQCFFSACNIDGSTSTGMKRGPWRLDPRIPAIAQIMKECYGNPPKFSRGHMTRREDPIWGTTEEAVQGNDDSMHVTNTVPQMQSMNGGVWLELENYALQNARKDDMKISVFTGPIFKPGDPTCYGIKIPLAFWKVIVFIHDETGKLCATGYSISQKDFIQEEEFVYGQQKTNQKKITWIEQQTGLSFGELSGLDPLNTDTEGFEMPLDTLEQIRFF